jgi:hypothetical protein
MLQERYEGQWNNCSPMYVWCPSNPRLPPAYQCVKIKAPHFTEQTVFLSAMVEQPRLDRFLLDTSGKLLVSGLVTEDLYLFGVLVPPALKGR